MLREKGVPEGLAEPLAIGGVVLGQEVVIAVDEQQKLAEKQGKRAAKRGLNEWQKYVKKNKDKYKYKSGSKKGQVNFKAMSRAFKKTPAGKKGRRKK